MITETIKKIKSWCQDNKNDLYVALIIFLVGMAGFGLGRLSVLWTPKEPIIIETSELETSGLEIRNLRVEKNNSVGKTSAVIGSLKGQLVGSRNGSSYHLPWCPGAEKIKEENKIWFQTKEEAESRGYRPAANCPGL